MRRSLRAMLDGSAPKHLLERPRRLGDVKTGKGGTLVADKRTLATDQKGVFAGGDIVTGPASVIGAIAQGRIAAASIDKFLGGKGKIEEALAPIEEMDPLFGEDANFSEKKQPAMPELEANKRQGNFTEVEFGYSEQAAVDEARRCYKCHYRLKLSHPMQPPVKVKSV